MPPLVGLTAWPFLFGATLGSRGDTDAGNVRGFRAGRLATSVRSGQNAEGVMMLGLPITMLGLQIETPGELVAAIGYAILLSTLLWMAFLLLWKFLNWFRPFRVLGGRYAINIISDPPGNGFEGVGDIVRSRIGDEVLFARKGARTYENVDRPRCLGALADTTAPRSGQRACTHS